MTILPVYVTSNKLSHVVIDNSNVGYTFNCHAPYRWVVSKVHVPRVTR